MNDIRQDKKTAVAVNKGLAASFLTGLPSGIKIMSAGGVPKEVLMRVLLEPEQRRASDWKRQ